MQCGRTSELSGRVEHRQEVVVDRGGLLVGTAMDVQWIATEAVAVDTNGVLGLGSRGVAAIPLLDFGGMVMTDVTPDPNRY